MITAAASLLPVAPTPAQPVTEAGEAATGQPFVAVLAAALAAPVAPTPMPAAAVVVPDVEVAGEATGDDADSSPPTSVAGKPAAESVAPEGGTPGRLRAVVAGDATALAARSCPTGSSTTPRIALPKDSLPVTGEQSIESAPVDTVGDDGVVAETNDSADSVASEAPSPVRADVAVGATALAAAAGAATARGRPDMHGAPRRDRAQAAASPPAATAAPDTPDDRAASPARSRDPGVNAARSTAAGVLVAVSERNAALRQAAEHAAPQSILASVLLGPDDGAAAPPESPPDGAPLTVETAVRATSDGETAAATVTPRVRQAVVTPGSARETVIASEAPHRALERHGTERSAEATDAPEPVVPMRADARPIEREPLPSSGESQVESSPLPRLPWVASDAAVADVVADAPPPRAAAERTPARVAPTSPSFVTVELDPETAGAQRVRVAVRGDTVHATVVTDSGGAEALRPQLGELRQALEGQGFREATVQLRTSGEAALAAPVAGGQELRARGESAATPDGAMGDPHTRGRQRGQDHQQPGQGRRSDPEEEMA